MDPGKLDLRDNQAFWRRNVFGHPRPGLFWVAFFKKRSQGQRGKLSWSLAEIPDPGKRFRDVSGLAWLCPTRFCSNITDKLIIGNGKWQRSGPRLLFSILLLFQGWRSV